jgi:hypothetical protein
MEVRHVLIALLVAFGVAAAIAAATTINHVRTATSSLSQPVTRI